MESEIPLSPTPHWVVQTTHIPVPGKNDKNEYHWKLNNPGNVEIPRYYPANFGINGTPAWYFLPERLWVNRDELRAKREVLPLQIWDARLANGQTSATPLKKMAAVIELLYDGQRDFETHGGMEDESKYMTFEKVAEVTEKTRYVRIRDKDVQLMVSGGGRDQPEEIYMDRKLIDQFVAGRDSSSGYRFEIRTGDGEGRFLEIDTKVSITQKEWKARLDRAIRSIDREGGWSRMINPNLKLYLVAISPNWGDFSKIVEKVMAAGDMTTPLCRQTVEVLTNKDIQTHSAVLTPPLTHSKHILTIIWNRGRSSWYFCRFSDKVSRY